MPSAGPPHHHHTPPYTHTHTLTHNTTTHIPPAELFTCAAALGLLKGPLEPLGLQHQVDAPANGAQALRNCGGLRPQRLVLGHDQVIHLVLDLRGKGARHQGRCCERGGGVGKVQGGAQRAL